MKEYHAIGLMSGSSLDGLDIAYCRFTETGRNWNYEILDTFCIPYSEEWLNKLRSATSADTISFQSLHTGLGRYFGQKVGAFMEKFSLKNKVDFIASHGHTIFHFPERQMTCQIGEGAALCNVTGLPVICDFRTLDIAAGGQGTPIVPIGDLLLFKEYSCLLNLGGIGNISVKNGSGIIAFDICPVNQVLNFLSNQIGKPYDDRGQIAASGTVNKTLLENLNRLIYYQLPYPKSLDNGFSSQTILPIIAEASCSVEDQLCTYVEHIAIQVELHLRMAADKDSLGAVNHNSIMVTGGGAHNDFLLRRIHHICGVLPYSPDKKLIEYKEAMVIAFMGVLRMRNEVNVLASVTGASHNTIGGAVYRPAKSQ